ncbi:MAG TPA: hypothetical protein VKU44_05640 [Terriglobia bacterium]|nr:hypothetical protein [Terriglobia bacterium]
MSDQNIFDALEQQIAQMREHFTAQKTPVPVVPSKRWTQGPCYTPDASDQVQALASQYDGFRLAPGTDAAPNPAVLGSMKDPAVAQQLGIEPDPPEETDRWFFQAFFYGSPKPEVFGGMSPQNIVP